MRKHSATQCAVRRARTVWSFLAGASLAAMAGAPLRTAFAAHSDFPIQFRDTVMTRRLTGAVAGQRGVAASIKIESTDAGPGFSRIRLYDGRGHVLDRLEGRRILGVRFIRRGEREPFLELERQSGGTGVQEVEVTWYCLDGNRLECVLNFLKEGYHSQPYLPGGAADAGDWNIKRTQAGVVEPLLMLDRPWPAFHLRSTTETTGEGPDGKRIKRLSRQTKQDQYEFDPKLRRYRVTATKELSDPGGDHP